ncbi:hypothetical protein D9M72_560040 [compost metagenome]
MDSVLSTISGTPASWATPETPSMSRTSWRGLDTTSPKKSLVFGRTASFHCWRLSGSSTNVTEMPNFFRVWASRLYVPP